MTKERVGPFVFKSMTTSEVTRVIDALPLVMKSGDDLRTLLAVIVHRYDIDDVERLKVLEDAHYLVLMAANDAAIEPTHTGSERIN